MLKIDSFNSNLISFKKPNKSIDINIINFILCISMIFLFLETSILSS